MAICIAENSGGKGGVGGGAGADGQASQVASGAGAHGYGYPCLEAVTDMTATFDIQLTKDYNGEIASDLSDIDTVKFMAKPTMVGGTDVAIETDCTFTDDGKVTLELTPTELNTHEGVWAAEFMCYNEDDELVQTYRAYLCIRKGMTGTRDGNNPITVMDVRLALMDTSAELNELLDDLEFSDMMILNAVQRAIDEWEETPPDLTVHYNSVTFPWREHLIKGAIGFLLQMVMYRYMRNHMQYSASGLTVDKNDKGNVYLQLAQMARQEWKNFLNAKKTSLNMDECWAVLRNPFFE